MDKDLKRIEIYCVIAGLEHFLFTTIKGSISFFCLFFLCVNLIESSEPRKVESDEPSVKMVDKKNTHTHTHTHTYIYICYVLFGNRLQFSTNCLSSSLKLKRWDPERKNRTD